MELLADSRQKIDQSYKIINKHPDFLNSELSITNITEFLRLEL